MRLVNPIDARYAAAVDLDAYVSERRGEWNRLETLTRRRRLSAREADEMVLLYQRAATHLSVVRSHSPDPILLASLSQLVLAGRASVTGGRRFSWHPIGRFFTTSLPLELHRTRFWWLGTMLVGVLLSWALIEFFAGRPEAIERFAPGALSGNYSDEFVGYYSEYRAQNFFARVWSNNALIAGQCLASGVLIVPVFYVLGSNLFHLGLTGGLMVQRGEAGTFFAYLLPHGFLELTAIFVAAGVGLRIGWSWIAPGPHRTRRRALVESARGGMVVALGLVVVLLISAVVEAWVTPSGWPDPVRIGVGLAVWLGFLCYALYAGSAARRRAAAGTGLPDGERDEIPTA